MDNTARPLRQKKQKPVKRNAGLGFFWAALFILVFTLLYSFTEILPSRTGLSPAQDEIFVSFIDVGQGDSILIRSAGNAVLIDGGEHRHRHRVIQYIREADITKLDIVVATHPHSDHIGSFPTVLSLFDVGLVAMPDVTHNTETFANFLEAITNNDLDVVFPLTGDVFQAGIIHLEVLSPSFVSDDINNSSIVLRLSHGGTSFVFTGDAEREAEEIMLASGLDISADVLKVGHHGSRTSTTQRFLEAVSPRFAVITVGANNPFGHPHLDVVNRLHDAGTEIFRTDVHGNILMSTDGKEITIHVGSGPN